jgi:type I restriction enzyme S subunit
MRILKDIFKISKGKKAEEVFFDTGLRYIQIGDLRNDDIIKYTQASASNVLCTNKDILIAWDGANAGTVGYDLEGVIGSTLAKLSPKIEDINSSYVGRFLQSKFFYLRENCTGATIPHLSRPVLENLQIPLPPLETQQKIAAILDAADTLRQKDKALVAKYDELTQALFLDMFGDPVSNPKGWKLKKGSKYYEVRGRVGWKGYKKTDLRQIGAIVLGATHINNLGTIDLSKVVYLSEEKFLESPEIMVQKFDLIFVQRGNTIGKVALVRTELGDATINPVVLIFRPINSNPYFLLYLLMNKELNREFVASNSGSAQPMITQKTMKDFLMIDVPIKSQTQFAERVVIIEKQKAITQASLEKSEELFNSLLQKAFKGELV